MRSVGSERLSSVMEGSEVEISYKNNGFRKVWYKAEVNSISTLRGRCVWLLKDGSSTLLANEVTLRPIPPEHLQAGVDIKEGSIVDADHKGGWWTGLVVKQTEDDKCLVLFDSPPDIILFERKHLRPHLDWLDERLWMLPGPDEQFLRRLHEKSMFISGTMVEVSDTIDKGEVVWVPSMIIKEIEEEEENDEKKYIVKACDNPLNLEGIETRPNRTVHLRSLRPKPPPFSAEEHQLVRNFMVEVFDVRHWRQGRVVAMVPGKRCWVNLRAINMEGSFKLSDIRPSKVWEDGVWKPRKSPLTQGSVSASVMNAKESGPPVTPSPCKTATPLIQTRENGSSEDNNRKRKREQSLSSANIVEENEAKDITMVLPFEKKLPIWKTLESMEVFKKIPQRPHFSPLLEIREDSRELSAVGMMLTFSGLLEEVKDLQLNNAVSSLTSLSDSFAELEKHGFDVEVPKLRISKLLSLRDRQAKNLADFKSAEKVTAEKESIKDENQRKILELRKLNEEVDKEVAQSKSCEATIVQQLEDVDLQFHITASAPW